MIVEWWLGQCGIELLMLGDPGIGDGVRGEIGDRRKLGRSRAAELLFQSGGSDNESTPKR
jgi:hypothetical protein